MHPWVLKIPQEGKEGEVRQVYWFLAQFSWCTRALLICRGEEKEGRGDTWGKGEKDICVSNAVHRVGGWGGEGVKQILGLQLRVLSKSDLV